MMSPCRIRTPGRRRAATSFTAWRATALSGSIPPRIRVLPRSSPPIRPRRAGSSSPLSCSSRTPSANCAANPTSLSSPMKPLRKPPSPSCTASGKTRQFDDAVRGSQHHLLLFFFRLELQGDGVDAVAQAGGLARTVLEDVAEVRAAVFAGHFGAVHEERVVFMILDVLRVDGPVEAGPAAAGIELVFGGEEFVAAGGAMVHPRLVVVVERPAEGAFRPLLAHHAVLLRRQLFLPVGLWHVFQIGHVCFSFPLRFLPFTDDNIIAFSIVSPVSGLREFLCPACSFIQIWPFTVLCSGGIPLV